MTSAPHATPPQRQADLCPLFQRALAHAIDFFGPPAEIAAATGWTDRSRKALYTTIRVLELWLRRLILIAAARLPAPRILRATSRQAGNEELARLYARLRRAENRPPKQHLGLNAPLLLRPTAPRAAAPQKIAPTAPRLILIPLRPGPWPRLGLQSIAPRRTLRRAFTLIPPPRPRRCGHEAGAAPPTGSLLPSLARRLAAIAQTAAAPIGAARRLRLRLARHAAAAQRILKPWPPRCVPAGGELTAAHAEARAAALQLSQVPPGRESSA